MAESVLTSLAPVVLTTRGRSTPAPSAAAAVCSPKGRPPPRSNATVIITLMIALILLRITYSFPNNEGVISIFEAPF
jgi:hypothetical protein